MLSQSGLGWYSANFPEALFPPKEEFRKDYIHGIGLGLQIIPTKRVLIASAMRDVAKNLQNTIPRIVKLGEMFQSYDICIYENDSIDNTPTLLKMWQEFLPNLYVTSQTLGTKYTQDKSLARRVNMANARNHYLNFLYNNIDKYDCLIVVDGDLQGGWSYEGIIHSFGYFDMWNCIASNGLLYRVSDKVFYDIWAYRPIVNTSTNFNLIELTRGQPIYRVVSAFGGLAIYKTKPLYDIKLKYTPEDCDHVTINSRLGKVYINPSQITLYSPTMYTL